MESTRHPLGKKWHKTKWGFCVLAENPVAWGTQTAADEPSEGYDPALYGQAPMRNPSATGLAIAMSSDEWDYSGLPSFYDLSEDALKDDDPRLRHAVRLRPPQGPDAHFGRPLGNQEQWQRQRAGADAQRLSGKTRRRE